MSKYAVLLLPIFIISSVIIQPLITKGFAAKNYHQDFNNPVEVSDQSFMVSGAVLLARNYSLFYQSSQNSSPEVSQDKKPRTIKILVTAYSSSPDETDSTPLITASGNYVRPGIVAANFLAFGTKIRLPKIFGNQVFVVEDRLHQDYNDRIDVWFSTKEGALKFGFKISEMEIL